MEIRVEKIEQIEQNNKEQELLIKYLSEKESVLEEKILAKPITFNDTKETFTKETVII